MIQELHIRSTLMALPAKGWVWSQMHHSHALKSDWPPYYTQLGVCITCSTHRNTQKCRHMVMLTAELYHVSAKTKEQI